MDSFDIFIFYLLSNSIHRYDYYGSRRDPCPVRDDSEYRFDSFWVTNKGTCHAHCWWAYRNQKYFSIREFIATTCRSAGYLILIIDTSTEQYEYCQRGFWAREMSTLADNSEFVTYSFRGKDKARPRQQECRVLLATLLISQSGVLLCIQGSNALGKEGVWAMLLTHIKKTPDQALRWI